MSIRSAVCFAAFVVKADSFQSSRTMSSSLRSLASATLYAGRGISVSEILKSPQWPEKWPFTARDFSRQAISCAFDLLHLRCQCCIKGLQSGNTFFLQLH